MATSTAPRTSANGPAPVDFHRTCWRVLSAATAHGAPPISYLLDGSAVPSGQSVLTCHVCGDRWAIPAGSPWLVLLRRQLLAVLVNTPAASDAA